MSNTYFIDQVAQTYQWPKTDKEETLAQLKAIKNSKSVFESAIDLEVAKQFIHTLTQASPGTLVSFQTWHDFPISSEYSSASQYTCDPSDSKGLNNTLKKLRTQNLKGYNIGVVINESGPGLKLTSENIVRPRALFVDIDKIGNQKFDYKPLAELGLGKPHIVVQTRRGKHLYWLVDESVTNKRWEQCQQALIWQSWSFPADKVLENQVGSDVSIKNLDRKMRLPGFLHFTRKDVVIADGKVSGVKELVSPVTVTAEFEPKVELLSYDKVQHLATITQPEALGVYSKSSSQSERNAGKATGLALGSSSLNLSGPVSLYSVHDLIEYLKEDWTNDSVTRMFFTMGYYHVCTGAIELDTLKELVSPLIEGVSSTPEKDWRKFESQIEYAKNSYEADKVADEDTEDYSRFLTAQDRASVLKVRNSKPIPKSIRRWVCEDETCFNLVQPTSHTELDGLLEELIKAGDIKPGYNVRTMQATIDPSGDKVLSTKSSFTPELRRLTGLNWDPKYVVPTIEYLMDGSQQLRDPFVEYLESVPLMDVESPEYSRFKEEWFTLVTGIRPDNKYYELQKMGWLLMHTTLVARALSPGVAFDYMCIIQSRSEGSGKSTYFQNLFGRTYDSSNPAPNTVDMATFVQVHTSHKVLNGEDHSNRKLLANVVNILDEADKHFNGMGEAELRAVVTASHLQLRPLFKEAQEKWPMRGIYVGTSNPIDFLHSGENRRYLFISLDDSDRESKNNRLSNGLILDNQWTYENQLNIFSFLKTMWLVEMDQNPAKLELTEELKQQNKVRNSGYKKTNEIKEHLDALLEILDTHYTPKHLAPNTKGESNPKDLMLPTLSGIKTILKVAMGFDWNTKYANALPKILNDMGWEVYHKSRKLSTPLLDKKQHVVVIKRELVDNDPFDGSFQIETMPARVCHNLGQTLSGYLEASDVPIHELDLDPSGVVLTR